MTPPPPPVGRLALRDARSRDLLKRLLKDQAAPYRWHVGGALLCMAIVAAMSAAATLLLKPTMDDVFVGRDARMLWIIGGAVVAVFTLKSLASYAGDVLQATIGQHIVSDTQNRLFERLIDQDLALFQANPSGSLSSHFTFDINAMRTAVASTVSGLGRDALTVVLLVGELFYLDWRLACISLLVAPLSVYPIQRLSKRLRRTGKQTQEQMGRLNSTLTQAFQGIRVIKAYRLETYETTRVAAMTRALSHLAVHAARAEAAAQPIIDTFGGFAIAAVIVYGGSRVIEGTTTAGTFFAFIAATLTAYQPMRSLTKVSVSLQTGLAAAQRVFALIDRRPLLVDAPDAVALPRRPGPVCFEDVRFAYGDDDVALDGIDFAAPAGGVTALVGPSGAGKSTVLNLIPRFYDPQAGRILINGHDIRDVSLASLRDAIALVSQEIVLFDDTVANNIRCGRRDADDDAVRAAAEAAAALTFIEGLPQGFETLIGEQGLRLSGGQRQRIAIARALLKDAPLLLLDEATSALDTESERQIQTALATLMRGRTTIVIAHRLSTIRSADVIHVFERGRVTESGTHADLMAHNGLYARLHDLQFADAAPRFQ